jgi:hypothetical protein
LENSLFRTFIAILKIDFVFLFSCKNSLYSDFKTEKSLYWTMIDIQIQYLMYVNWC